MKAFISYSLHQQEIVLVSIVADMLRNQGFLPFASQNKNDRIIDFTSYSYLSDAGLFIGILSRYGQSMQRVLMEFAKARELNVPSLLLVENTLTLNVPDEVLQYVVQFDRAHPQAAIDHIGKMLARPVPPPTSPPSSNNNVLPWLLGGAAIIGAVALLANMNTEDPPKAKASVKKNSARGNGVKKRV